MEFNHYPVLLNEILEGLNLTSGKVYVDATLGGGGYSYEIAKAIQPTGTLIATDVDDDALLAAKEKLKEFDNVKIFKNNYSKIPQILNELGMEKITGGIVFDLGASYHQLTSDSRGFSFSKDSMLDMRYDLTLEKTAKDVVNEYKEEELVQIFSEYGEERFSKTIAREIVKQRKLKSFETTKELADFICKAVPFKAGHIHPATKVFQAIRIEVNNELKNLQQTLEKIIPLLEKDARIVVVSFHSLEDRIVKKAFRQYSSNCNCKPNDPICTCEPKKLELVNKKPILATQLELAQNPPSRSAKLRVAQRI
ncbi:MAG: 16S rRNA (cytosine(1402)-N(4))-methyltransferase RsmH [Candidatus Gastranaerophilales bacterium]|nr:16S rRNA (cytosine(1402)-N(4))-methyltransferase RsmH [Candidatus Gastranaerophilales bacterium]